MSDSSLSETMKSALTGRVIELVIGGLVLAVYWGLSAKIEQISEDVAKQIAGKVASQTCGCSGQIDKNDNRIKWLLKQHKGKPGDSHGSAQHFYRTLSGTGGAFVGVEVRSYRRSDGYCLGDRCFVGFDRRPKFERPNELGGSSG